MHGQNDGVVVLSLEFRGHVLSRFSNEFLSLQHPYPKHLVQRGLGRGIRGESVFHLPEINGGARVAAHEDHGADGNVGLQQLLRRDDGPYAPSIIIQGSNNC